MHKKSVLVVAAHPDDEVIGCGGTIAKLNKLGHEVNVVILGEGITSREQNQRSETSLLTLKENCIKACQVLGAHSLKMLQLPDNRFDSIPLLDIIKIIEEIIKEKKPEIIFTHHPGDLNIDHVLTSRAVLTATRPVPGNSIHELYLFEIQSSTEWSFNKLLPNFSPNYFNNIEKELSIKLDALKVYQSEIRNFPHPRSEKSIIAASQRWGSYVGLEAVEPFETVRIVNV